MDRLHHPRKNRKRQLGNAGCKGLKGYRKGSHLQGYDTGRNRRRRDPLFCHSTLHKRLPDQKPADKAAIERHIPDITPQRQKPPVRKHQTLYQQDSHHGQKASPGPQHRGQQHTAAEVPGRTRSGNCKIDHLRRKDKGSHHAHHRNLLRLIHKPYFFDRITHSRR